MSRVYAALFMGQGAWLTSFGIQRLAWRAQVLGIETGVYRYTEVDRAHLNIDAKRGAMRKIALVGYSLGCTTATYLQTIGFADLVCCIAESSLALNHRIDRNHTKRSVLWSGPGFLSDAGIYDDFDIIHQEQATHLLMDFIPAVTDGVIDELTRLQRI
jgi:hypothetical protein